MPRFSYKAYDRTGARADGELVAATREGALETLVRQGQIPVELAESSGAAEIKWWQREVMGGARLPVSILAMFTRELVSLVKAEIPIDECLRLVALQPMLPARLKHVVRAVLARVVEGESLSDALAAEERAFPELYWRLVKAGEASGALPGCLEDLAGFLERSADMRSKITSALLYPAVLIAAALAAVTVIMMVLVPAIAPIFEEAGAEPPLLIRAFAAVEQALVDYWPVALISGLASIVALVLAVRAPQVRVALDRAALSAPVLGGIIERRETGCLARTLATLIGNGVPIVDALGIAGGVLSNRAMRKAVEVASEEIKEGGRFSTPLARSGLFPDLLLRLTSIGEETGQLDVMLLRAAAIYEGALERQLERLTSLVTPVVTLLIGAVVGSLILTVMSALISVNDLALK